MNFKDQLNTAKISAIHNFHRAYVLARFNSFFRGLIMHESMKQFDRLFIVNLSNYMNRMIILENIKLKYLKITHDYIW